VEKTRPELQFATRALAREAGSGSYDNNPKLERISDQRVKCSFADGVSRRLSLFSTGTSASSFKGKIDDVQLYDRALSGEEITDLANGSWQPAGAKAQKPGPRVTARRSPIGRRFGFVHTVCRGERPHFDSVTRNRPARTHRSPAWHTEQGRKSRGISAKASVLPSTSGASQTPSHLE
jgi:hypothetical protein